MIHLSLVPLDGDPVAVRDLASKLTSGAGRLAEINAALASIKAGADWDSPAGEKFEVMVHESPPLLDGLIQRYATSAEVLRAFASDLETAQLQDSTARRRLADAVAEDRLLETLAAANTGNPEMTLQIQTQQREVADRVFEIRALHESATADFAEADLRLARRLRALADDSLEDSWHYRAVATVDETAASISSGISSLGKVVPFGDVAFGMVPGGSQVVVVTATATALSGAALRIIYGEGSWKQVAANSLGAVKVTGKTMQLAGVAGSNPVSKLVTRQRTYVGQKMSTTERLGQGARARLHESKPWLAKSLDPKGPLGRTHVPLTEPKLGALKGLSAAEKAGRFGAYAKAKAVHTADVQFRDGFRAASAGGDNAKKLYVAGSVLEKAGPKLKSEANKALAEKPEE